MAKRKKKSSVQMSLRMTNETHLVVARLAEATGWSESRCVALLITVADAAIAEQTKQVTYARLLIRDAAAAHVRLSQFGDAATASKRVARSIDTLIRGVIGSKGLPHELAS